MISDTIDNHKSPKLGDIDTSAYIYKAWQADQYFDIAIKVLRIPYGLKDFAMTVEALGSEGIPMKNVKTNWSFSEKFDSQFCYIPGSDDVGFCTMPFLSFQAPVYGLRITVRQWHEKTTSPAAFFGEVLVRQYYSSDPMDPTAAKLGSHVGIALREEA